jgi:hypothetical protein
MPAEYNTKFLEFPKFVTAARKKTCFGLEQIGNTDEFSLTLHVPSNRAGHYRY